MVFESVVVDLLNRFLGDYVKNLDRSQLKLGIWGGDVTLARLDVKESALDDLDLPVSVVSGHLSNLILKIPWKNLYTAPVVATVEGLYVVVVPNLAIKYDAEKEEKAAEDAKMKELQRIEEAKMKEAQKDEKKEQVDTFTEKLVTQIIKNLQVKIKDIHLRYEDPFTDPSQPFAAGVTLHNLSFETTDENWKPCIIQETVKMIHKLIVLDSFAVYWNSSCSMLNKMDAEVCKVTLQKSIATSSHKPLDMSYVLGPINASARLILNPKPETDGSNFQIPKVNLNVEMEKLALSINRIQYQDIMKLLQALDRMARASLYRKYRPNVPLKGNYMAWWKFAATCILEQDIRRRKREWSWDNMKQHRQQCRKYKECYKYRILGKRIPKDVQQTLEVSEKHLDLFNLTLVRKQAELEVAQMKDKGYDSCWGSWFGGWFGGGAKEEKKQNKITQQFEEAMSPEEKAKLYEAIGYQENAVPMEYPKEFIENKLCFILHNLVINIDDTSDKHVMQIGLQKVSSNIEQRPSDQAMKVVAEVETFMIFGTSYSDGSHPTMVTSQTSTQMKEPLLSVLFETNPLDRQCDQRIHICANPLEIVYNAVTINQLVEVFHPPQDIALQELQAVALMKLEDIKDTSALGLQHAIELHKKLDLQVDLKSSYVIIPEGGSFANASNCLIINLGNFKMNTVVRDHDVQTVKSLVRAGSTDEEVLTTMISQVYDKYNIDIQNIEILLTSTGDDWKKLRTEETSQVHLLNPVSVSVNMQMCIITEDPRLPKMKIHGELPLLNFIFSETKVKQLLYLVQSIPFPKSEPVPSGEEVSAVASATSVTSAPSANTSAKAIKNISLKSADEVLAAPDEKSKQLEDSTIVQYTDMELKFEIKEIGLDIYHQVENEDVYMLRFAVQKLGTEVLMKTFEMRVDLYLGGIYLHHKEFSRSNGSPLYILGNPYKDSMQNLFTLNYLKAEKKSPDFVTRYQNTLQSISVSFTNLDMVVHLEAILSLLDFSNHVTAALQSPSQETQPVASDDKLGSKTTEEEKNASEVNVHKKSGRRKHQEVIDIRIGANFESFGVAICTAQHELTSIKISGLHTEVTIQKAKTCVSTTLKKILMVDPSENATHPKILSVLGEEFLDVAVTIYNFATEDEGYFDMSAVDMSLRINVGRIRFIFMNKFISSLQSFADNFQTAKEKLAEASAAAAEVARHGMEMAYVKATRFLLNICVQAPVVIVPQNSSSTNTIMADLGVIKLHNKFVLDKKRNELGTPAIFEDMTIELHDLKLLRAQIESLSGNTVDECLLLEPITFNLVINRNLAFNWYKGKPEIDVFGKLEAVQMSVSQEDYGTVMHVLSENLAESGYDSSIAPIPSTDLQISQSKVKQEAKEKDAADSAADIAQLIPENVCQRIRFGFELHSISLSLYEGISNLSTSNAGRKSQKALACLELKKLCVSGKIMNDGTLSAKALLSDCVLNDTRPTRQSGIKRLMQRIDCSDDSERSMITVNFGKDRNNDTTLNVKVFSFQLILHLGYLMQLGDFFTKAMVVDQNVSDGMPTASVAAETTSPSSDAAKESTPSRTTIIFQLEQPDLILIEDVEDINSNIVVLKNAVEMKLIMNPDAMNISGAVKDLQVYTAQYNPIHRENSTVQILSPCEITLLYSSPSDKSQHIHISFSTVELHVSPGTVEILSNITSALFVPGTPEELEKKSEEEDYSKIWEPRNLADCSFWFLETVKPKESAEEITENYVVPSPVGLPETLKTEQLLLDIKRIVIIVEAGRGKRTVPMILIESSFCSEVKNWSHMLYIGCSLTTEMGYYNEKMAVWEPIVEPVEIPSGHQRPWELLIEVTKNPLLDMSENTESSEEEEELKFLPPEMSISILSNDVMEVTITKTFMDVVSHLSQAFTDAMKSSAVRVDVEEAPYVVKNELGIPVTIKLSQDIFKVLGENSASDIDAIMLESGAKVNLIQKTAGRTKHDDISILKKQDTHEDIFFSAQIEIEDNTSVRTVTVARTDKRLFLLPCRTYPGDQWGFVVDIVSQAGSKIITFLSPVEIVNHFSIPLEIYYMLPSGNEVQRCGFIEPHKKIHLPIQAVFTATRELFFKPAEMDYTVSTHSFVWKDIPEDTESNVLLQCSHKQPDGQPFLMEVSRNVNRIFFEDTQKKTMVSVYYTISLRPTVLLNNLLPFSIKYCLQDVDKEYVLKPGEHAELWTAEIGRTGIEIKIPDYLDCEWVCYKKLEVPTNELSVWSFDTSTALDKKLTLDLGMRSVKLKGSLELSIYCPFWMVNKTGLQLTYRTEETNVINHPPTIENPVLFSFKAKTFFAKKKASLKIGDSEWSDKFSLDVVGSQGTVLAKSKNGQTYGVGVQIKLSNAGLTKIVIFTPYYLLINSSKYDIEVRENISNGEWIGIPSNECVPFWPKDAKKTEMVARYAGTLDETIPFSFKQPHTTLLKLSSNKGGLNIDVQVAEASIILKFDSYHPGFATVLLVNHLEDCPIVYCQSDKSEKALKNKQAVLYTWEDPCAKRELTWSIRKKSNRTDLIKDGIGQVQLENKEIIYWVSFLDGMQRVLLFTDDIALATASQQAGEFERIEQEILISLQGIGLSLIDNIARVDVMYLGIASSGIIWEAKKLQGSRYKPLSVKECLSIEQAYQRYQMETKIGKKPKSRWILDGKLEVDFAEEIMYKPQKRNLRRSFQTGLWVQYKTSPHQLQLHAKINKLQIDNQLKDCVFPVVLAPIPLPKSVAADNAPKPFTEASIMIRKAEYSSIKQFKYCKILVQEFHVKLDQGFLNSLISFFSAEEATDIDYVDFLAKDKTVVDTEIKAVAETYSSQELKNFYDILHFSPLKVHISFSMTGSGAQDQGQPTAIHSDFLNLLLQSIGVTLTEVQDIIFRLDYFERQYAFMTQKQLINEASSHYINQTLKQLYMLVLGLDVIGNPVGLLFGLSEGVGDLFYEPFQGAIQGPEEFAEGLALGVKSLFGHAVGGAAGAVSRITGTLGKGLAALTMDEEYQKKRRQDLSQRPTDLGQGLARSGKGLLVGVYEGVTGVVTKPLEGAKEEGVEGFFKGVGKGLIGVVARPTSGAIDFASGSLDAVKRATEMSDEVKRLRPPRFIKADAIIRPYSRIEAEGYQLFCDVEKGKFINTDHYLAHCPIGADGKSYLMITTNRLMLIVKGDVFGQWSTDWHYTWEEIARTEIVTGKGIKIVLKDAKKKKTLFGSKDTSKMANIQSPQMCEWMEEKIEEAMKRSL